MFDCVVIIIYLLVKTNSQLITRSKPEYIYMGGGGGGVSRRRVKNGEGSKICMLC